MTSPTDATEPAPGASRRLHAQARDAYLASARDGQPVTGAVLGAQFGRSRSWGNARITEARQATNHPQPADAQGNAGRPPATPSPAPGATSLPPGTASAGTGTTSRPPGTTSAGTGTPSGGPDRRRAGWPDRAIILAVAAVSAASSYAHMLEVALLAGEPVWVARAFPVTVDGLVLAALRRGHDGRRWLALGLAVSVAANILANFPALAADAGPVVSAIPPLALYGTHRLLHHTHQPHATHP